MINKQELEGLYGFTGFEKLKGVVLDVMSKQEQAELLEALQSKLSGKEVTLQAEKLSQREAFGILEEEAGKPNGGIDANVFVALMNWKNRRSISNINDLLKLAGVIGRSEVTRGKYHAQALFNLLTFANIRNLKLKGLSEMVQMEKKGKSGKVYKNDRFDRHLYMQVSRLGSEIGVSDSPKLKGLSDVDLNEIIDSEDIGSRAS